LTHVLLLIPPLTQLNTPYPATAYLSGFLRSKNIATQQGDLGLDLVLRVFSGAGFKALFDEISAGNYPLNEAQQRILFYRSRYEETIDDVIAFLQHKNYTLAYNIVTRNFLPEGERFKTLSDIDWFFGHIGVQDKARYLATLYLEDVADLIQATAGPHFGFSKYAERIARTATSFDGLEKALSAPTGYFDKVLLDALEEYFQKEIPQMVAFTVPFGGNLYGALKCGQWIKQNYPQTKVVMGGGYPNTELRDLTEPRVFDYVDFITLDDGEGPLLALHQQITSEQPDLSKLKRTFFRKENQVVFVNDITVRDFGHAILPAPTYEGLRTHDYLSVIDLPNPMHRLWNDGRWNKLTIAHGCYWKKCSFCDISLDYIGRYEQSPASSLVDKMEALIRETGETGFHFVDEAAPPLAMRDLAIEILRRKLKVTWWTNIRFEKTFSEDLCKLLAASGCIAVTGGLEVASPRLLELIEKGITIDQVARVCKGFRDAGILVHAYLMYGFPTQTEQETIDSLEVVRQLFQHGLLQSAHWHQFAMTVHSPVGKNPEKYHVIKTGPEFKGFANNDLYHEDPQGADHEIFSEGLKKALYNYMHHIGIDWQLQKFFNFKIPKPKVHPLLIQNAIKSPLPDPIETPGYRMTWLHARTEVIAENEQNTKMRFDTTKKSTVLEIPTPLAKIIRSQESALNLFSQEPLMLSNVLNQLSEEMKLDATEIIRKDWWKNLRNDVVWVLRK
jgi:radical SAM superfamily enzyme YgiQ (UPF0313 family)